ncbi:MAG TPA: hypothetical protein VFB79_07245 [Candidatus Angelobacter sp.]|nr:hypothetical protein [Candidatus Angelobacter sp.]
MATPVQLSLTIDPGGSLSVIDAMKQKWQSFVSSMNNSLGSFKGVADGFGEIESSETKAHQAATLLTETLGVEMPRALEKALAKSSVLMPLLAAGLGVSQFAAALPVLAEMGDKIKDLMDDAAGYTEKVKEIRQATIEASKEAFIKPETLATAQANNAALVKQVGILNGAASIETSRKDLMAMQNTLEGKLVALLGAGVINAMASADLSAKALVAQDQQRQVLEQMTRLKQEMNQLEDEAAAKQNEAGLQGYALAKQQLQDYENSKTYLSLKVLDKEKANAELEAHEADYNNAVLTLARQNAEQTISLRHQVVEDGLVGIAKIYQAEVDQINDVNRLQAESLISRKEANAQRVLIAQKADQQIAEYQRQEQQETTQLQNEATLSGLQNDAALIASAQFKYAQLFDLKQRGLIDDDNFNARELALAIELDNQLVQSEKDRMRRTKELQDEATEDFKTAQEDAALAVVPEWQRATAQLEIELNRRLRAIQDEKIKELSAENLTADQIVAINQIADAKRYDAIVTTNQRIAEENKRNVEQLGSDLQSVFDDIGSGNIGKRIISNMEKLFFEILAQWILTSQQMKSVFGGLFGTALFGPGSMESQLGQGAGGGSAAGGIGSLLGGLFGGSSSQSAQIPAGAGASFSGVPLLSASGGGIAPSSATAAATGSPDLNSIFNTTFGIGSPFSVAPGAGGALTTASLTSSGVLNAAPSAGIATSAAASGKNSLFGGLFQGGITNGLISLGGIATALLGGKVGGTTGQIGGALMGLLVTGKLGGVISSLYGSIGLAASGALVGSAIGGLLGFGVGSNSGGLFGSLAGIGSGALSGFLVGGPIGALVGGLVGLIGGIFGGIFGGSKRKKAAQNYFTSQVQPAISSVVTQYEDHSLDYATATSDLEQLRSQAQDQMKSLKGEGKDEMNKVISPAIDAAEKQINDDEAERTRRAGLTFGPPQFHDGGFVSAAMSAWTTKPGELLAVLKHGEYVMSPQATAKNRDTLERMNAGGSPGGTVHHHYWNVQTMDAASFDRWARAGGAKSMSKALNRYWNAEGNS